MPVFSSSILSLAQESHIKKTNDAVHCYCWEQYTMGIVNFGGFDYCPSLCLSTLVLVYYEAVLYYSSLKKQIHLTVSRWPVVKALACQSISITLGIDSFEYQHGSISLLHPFVSKSVVPVEIFTYGIICMDCFSNQTY